MSEGQRETFKHAIVIEEAHHILLRKKQEMTGEEAVTDIILREIRELGESIILIDQHPSLISMPALGNTYTTICMNLKHKADMSTISESLLLDREQIDFLGQLEVGTAIVKLQGRHFLPFLVKIPLFPIRKGIITDEEIKRKNENDSYRWSGGVVEWCKVRQKDKLRLIPPLMKSFCGVQGRFFQKEPLAAGGKTENPARVKPWQPNTL